MGQITKLDIAYGGVMWMILWYLIFTPELDIFQFIGAYLLSIILVILYLFGKVNGH